MQRRLAVICLVAALFSAPGAFGGDDDLAKELPRIPATEPANALKTFQVHEGFQLDPIAVEPLIADPVSVCYDADGRMYVVEMRGYPYPEKVASGNVKLLEDANGDGKFDKGTIFVDDLSWPTSVVPYDGGVFIAVPPEILYAKDTNGDGKADVKKVMFRGFGTQNVQALVNGLLWGQDGWIYGVSGGNGGDIENLTRPDARPVSVRGRDFRFRPDGSAFEAISGGGQFGHSFDDWGHRFTSNNSNHIRQIVLPADAVERNPHYSPPAVITDIAVEGGAGPVFRISPPEPWRVVRTRQRAADPAFVKRAPASELAVTGFFTSATGVTIYRGTAYSPVYRGNAFVGDVGGNLVHRKTLAERGAIFQATRADKGVEFVASTDNWFRPVNFTNTPDGTLLIIDMYRETIEHPASIPEPIKKHLDLVSGHDRGRLYQVIPDGFKKRAKPALGQAKTADLVALLADPDSWWRETAQRLLIEKNDPSALPLLRDLAKVRPTPLARSHALWTLQSLGALPEEPLSQAATDPDPRVREQAARLLGLHVAETPELGPVLAKLATTETVPMVRFQAALALGALKDDALAVPALASIASKDAADPWTRSALLCSINHRARPLIESLSKSPEFFDSPSGRVLLGDLAFQIGAEKNDADMTWLLTEVEAVRDDPALARAAVLGLGKGLQRSGGSLRAVLAGPAAKVVAPLFTKAAEVASGDGKAASRAEAVRLLGLGPVDVALTTLPDLLDARQPGNVQLAALQTLADLPDRRVGPEIIAHWKGLGPSVRREAAEALLARADRVAALLDALESKEIAPADLDPARRQQLISHSDPKVRERATRLIGKDAKSDRGPVIASYRKALDLDGNADRGREVFRKQCATCHKAEGVGTDVGPNLATITGRTPEDLLIHILDPNREVAPAYVNYTLETSDGQILTGLIADESANSVTLKRAEGATDTVPRARIEAMASTGLSLMPEGLEKEVSPEQLADLLSYVRGINTNAPAAPAP